MRSSRFKSFEKMSLLIASTFWSSKGILIIRILSSQCCQLFKSLRVSANLFESLRVSACLCEPQVLNFVTLLWNHSQNCYFWQKFGSKVGNTENKGSILSGWNFFLFVVFCAICSLVCHTRSSIFAWPAKLGTCFKHKDTNHILLLFNE